MSRTRHRPAPQVTSFGKVLAQAHNVAKECAGRQHTPDIPTMRDESWQLIHLLGAFSDLTAARAAHTGDCPQHHQLYSDDGVEPARHVAHACRGWTDLRHALDNAQNACRELYTALSHLNTQYRPDNNTGPSR